MEKQKKNLSTDMEKQTTKARHKKSSLISYILQTEESQWKKNKKRKNIG